MGACPVVLVPTHRSYGDFILIAFICFAYGIEIPCVAAGLGDYDILDDIIVF